MPWLHLSQNFLSSLSQSTGGVDALFQYASDFVSSFDVLWSNFDMLAQRATESFEWLYARLPK
jgi:hypothetical protein